MTDWVGKRVRVANHLSLYEGMVGTVESREYSTMALPLYLVVFSNGDANWFSLNDLEVLDASNPSA